MYSEAIYDNINPHSNIILAESSKDGSDEDGDFITDTENTEEQQDIVVDLEDSELREDEIIAGAFFGFYAYDSFVRKEKSEEFLRAQVSDFLEWLKGQGII